jgi:hypothetical protein
VHDNHALCPRLGRAAQELASAYSADRWADRWVRICAELMQPAG